MSASNPSWKRMLPAAAGAVLLAGIALVVLLRREGGTPETQAAAQDRPAPEPTATAPRPREVPPDEPVSSETPEPSSSEPPRPEEEPEAPTGEPSETGLEHLPDWMDEKTKAEIREQRKEWQPLSKAEKVARTRTFLKTWELREEAVAKQLADAEDAGDKAKAKAKRIELERLRKRKADIERALLQDKLP